VRPVLRRWWRGSFGRPLRVYFHETYRWPVTLTHVAPTMSPRRSEDALTWALHRGVVDPAEVVASQEVSFTTAELVHDAAYLAKLDHRETIASIVGSEPEVTTVQVLETWRRACGATVDGARWARRTRGRAVNLLGGFHHAAPDRGGGFCALNDIAIAVAALRSDGLEGPVVVVDLDAHPPDGVVACLVEDPELTVLSVSVRSSWTIDEPGRVTLVDERLPPGTGTEPYLRAVDQLLERLPSRPRMAFYLAGTDPLAGDPLGELGVSEEGLRQRDRRVLRALRDVPTVVMPGGGYRLDSWRVLAGTIAEAAGARRSVHPSYDPLLRRTREIMRALDPSRLDDGDSGVLITEEELFGSLTAAPRPPARVLGYYSRHGIEYALNAYGYWQVLERMGFEDLKLELSQDQGRDHVRVTARVGGERTALFDLVCRIQSVAGFRTLFVDWIELQDPRVEFSPSRPRLPGQRRPGLGLADETSSLLVRAAERLRLDGVVFVPAYYHVAWMGRRYFVVVDPELRGRFAALVEVLADVPLIEASSRLHEPGWPLVDGGSVQWTPTEMMIPISESARERFQTPDPEVEESRRAWVARLQPPPIPRGGSGDRADR